MKRHFLVFLALLGVIGISFSVDVSSCINITSTGTYDLTTDLSGAPNDASEFPGASDACIKIAASGVTLDCHDFNIDGTDALDSIGIAINGTRSGITIQNCNDITDYEFGIFALDISSSVFDSNTVSSNVNGIRVDDGDGNDYTDNTLDENDDIGLQVANMDGGLIDGNTVTSSVTGSNGVSLSNVDNALINGNDMTVDNNCFALFSGSSGNNITDNDAIGCGNVGFQFNNDLTNGNLIMGNNASLNGLDGFAATASADSNTYIGNYAFDNGGAVGSPFGNGFSISGGSGSNVFTDNIAFSNDGNGFAFDLSSGNILTGNNASGNSENGFFIEDNSSSNLFQNNLASGNAENGFEISRNTNGPSSSNNFDGDMAIGNSLDGFEVGTGFGAIVTGTILIDVNASLNGANGVELVSTNGTIIDPSFFCGNGGAGLLMSDSNGTIALDSTFCDNTGAGVDMTASHGGIYDGNDLYNNSDGFIIDTSSGGIFVDNEVHDNAAGAFDGFQLSGSDLNLFVANLVRDSSGGGANGFGLSDSDGNLFSANNVTNLSGGDADGFDIDGSTNDTFISNIVDGLSGGDADGFDVDSSSLMALSGIIVRGTSGGDADGFDFDDSSDVNITDSMAYNLTSGDDSSGGFDMDTVTSLMLTNVSAFNTSGAGIRLLDTDAAISLAHLYDNARDFEAEGSGPAIAADNLLFDSPGGGLVNYTNLSINDTLDSAYSIDHAAQPAGLVASRISFEQKFVNITNISGNVSIDSIVWHWDDAELVSYVESRFEIWRYNTEWSQQAYLLDSPSNTLSMADLANFSVFAILQGPGSEGGDGGGGGAGNPLSVDINSTAEGNVATVTSGGSPVDGAKVLVNGLLEGYTNASGQIEFAGCGADATVKASKDGYADAEATEALAACPACTANDDCAMTSQCVSNQCIPVPCACGAVESHQCVAYQCCADSDCPAGDSCVDFTCVQSEEPGCSSDSNCADAQYCDIPAGSASGECKDVVPGSCGEVKEHTFVPYGYECGTEPGCPSCPSGAQCVDHECVAAGALSCPSSGVVGQSANCTSDCPSCDYEVTSPDGKKLTGKTDENGNFELPLNLEGIYKVLLLKDGQPVKTVEINASPQSQPEEPEKPSATGGDPFSLLWLLVLLLLVILGIVYWRSRQAKK